MNTRFAYSFDRNRTSMLTPQIPDCAGPFLAALRASVKGVQPSTISPAHFTVFDAFLPEHTLQRLTQMVAERERDFRPWGVLHGAWQTPVFCASHPPLTRALRSGRFASRRPPALAGGLPRGS